MTSFRLIHLAAAATLTLSAAQWAAAADLPTATAVVASGTASSAFDGVVEAVRGLSFRMEEGELLGFIGPNGAGKSTTIKMLTGILHPTSGEARVLGHVPWKERRQLAYHIGTVFGQRSQLWMHLPAVDTFQLFGRIYELDPAETRRRIAMLATSSRFRVNR